MTDPQAEGLRWLKAAQEDLVYARHAAEHGFHAPACFFAQQAAEKAVKALHYAGGARAVLGHSVRALVENLTSSDLTGVLDMARELDLLYVPSRYPNGLDEGTPAEAFSASQSTRAIEHAEAILDACARDLT